MKQTRLFRLRSLAALLVVLGLSESLVFAAEELKSDPHRGGKVGWARLITPDAAWDLHSEQDPKLATFIRNETTLNIDPVWYSVRPDNVDQLCVYPFIYVKNLTRLTNPSHLQNIQEYIRRGGFICIDPCVNRFSSAQKLALIQKHAELFKQLFPECEVRELKDDHEIYHCFFAVTLDELYTPDMIRRGAIKPSNIGMRGIFYHDRMIAVVSTTGLECGWPETPQRMPACMKLIVNSYVYAMTH